MRVPVSWLKDYVDIDLDVETLAERLTMTGTKVEAVIPVGSSLRDIVACKVLELKRHPQSASLQIAKVALGQGMPVRQVVTAASNLAAGDLVPVVLPGGRIADGTEIGQMEFGGVGSEGMLCSARELGVSAQADGILHLDGGIAPGDDVVAHYTLADTVLEFEITPNRPDCLCVVGIAREVAAITGKTLRTPEVSFTELADAIEGRVSIDIDDPDLCPRYSARLFRLTGVGQSPIVMQARLSAAGVRPINAIVDVTNYVMLELNQPLHAFDFDAVGGGRIVVRRARSGESLVTLDRVERPLQPGMLVIADSEKPIAVAGVMGGEESEITDSTTTVLLESATFNRQSVWRTSRDLKLRTEASSRFEKGLDPATTVPALNRVAHLFEVMGAGKAFAGIVDNYPSPERPTVIRTTAARIDRSLGAGITAEDVRACLVPLGFGVISAADEIQVEVPSFRRDVTEEIDLAEEVVRIWGYNVVEPTLPGGAHAGGYSREYRFAERLRHVLTASGGFEALTFPFMSDADFDRLGSAVDEGRREAIRLLNPMVEDQALMRTTMIPSILASVRVNTRRSARGTFLFEIGRVYAAGPELAAGQQVPTGACPAVETRMLIGAMAGPREAAQWFAPERPFDFYDAKGVVQAIMEDLGIDHVEYARMDRLPYHPGRAASVVAGGRAVGVVGQLHPDVAAAYDVPEGTVLFELELEPLMELATFHSAYSPLPRFPGVDRDVAVVLPIHVPAEGVKQAIVQAGGDLVESVRLFDVYTGPQVGEGNRSLAYTVTYRSMERTLTDDEVNQVHARVRQALVDQFGAALR